MFRAIASLVTPTSRALDLPKDRPKPREAPPSEEEETINHVTLVDKDKEGDHTPLLKVKVLESSGSVVLR